MTVDEMRARMGNLEWLRWAAFYRKRHREQERATKQAQRRGARR